MKKISTLCTLLLSGFVSVSAQTYPLFNTSETIDAGNIKAAHLVHGDMWWDPATSTARCEYPKGSGKNVAFTSSLWMGGYDSQNNLRFAAQKYRKGGKTDYWPGPIDTGNLATVPYATSQKWAKIWKINRNQLDSFLKLSTHTRANTPLPILEWPAYGNPYAKGASGATLTITQPMAPFVDVNSDGIYNPLTGDYPAIKGDQMLWWVINDYGATSHDISNAGALGVDLKISAYVYHRNVVSDNIIFYEYQIKNHAASSYTNFRLGIMADLDLGEPFDDYTGFDSTHRMGIVYNGTNIDGSGGPRDYGFNPPIAGVAIVEMPGDAINSYSPAGSYMPLTNTTGPDGDPTNGLEMYRTMNSSNRAGTPLPNGRHYRYNVDSECVRVNVPGDRRFIISTNDMFLDAGASKKIGLALVVASGGGCPEFNPASLYLTADTAFKYYWNPPAPPPSTGINNLTRQTLHIYPNPATNTLMAETGNASGATIQIYDGVGRLCNLPITRSGNKMEVNTTDLSPGIYTIRYQDATTVKTAVFVKQ